MIIMKAFNVSRILLCFYICFLATIVQCIPLQNGILVIPGIAGSGLYGTLKEAILPECDGGLPLSAPRTRLWASIVQGLPPISRQRCWAAKLSLDWKVPIACGLERWGGRKLNSKLMSACEPQYVPLEGVEVTVDNGTHGVDYLDYMEGLGVFGTKYFHDMLELLRHVGYVDGDTLLAYPFDWRYPPWQLRYDELKQIIEDFVRRHPEKKVMIVSHSLGAVLANTFLSGLVDEDWKAKHIEGFVSIAGAFGGSHKTIRSLISGNREATLVDFFGVMNISLVPSSIIRATQRTFGSMYALAPSLKIFGNANPIITILPRHHISHEFVQARTANIAVWSLYNCPFDSSFFFCLYKTITGKKLDSDTVREFTLADWWKVLPPSQQPMAIQAQEKEGMMSLEDPGVPVYCFWSRFDAPTTELAYEYDTFAVENASPFIKMGFGDNTLLVESAGYCQSWKSTVLSREFRNLDHMGILMDRNVIHFVVSLVSGIPFFPDSMMVMQ